jgi:hypothetical protein
MCCFCGGENPTETRDHVPNRAFFRARDWPEGYEFPSCAGCNSKTSLTELVVSALARSEPASTEQDLREVIALYAQWAQRDRQSFVEFVGVENAARILLPPSIHARATARRAGEMNIGERLNRYLEVYAEKLLRALYYKHTNIIAPSGASIESVVISNGQIGESHEIEMRKLHFRGQPILVRCSNSKEAPPLSEQFHYTYGVEPDIDTAVFKIRLNESFLIAGAVDPVARSE